MWRDPDYGIVTVYPRVRISKARAVRVFDARKGVCLICKRKIDGVREDWHVAHDQALALCGNNDDSNLWPAHARCNMEEAYTLVKPAAAKAARTRAKHLGVKKSKNPLPCGRNSKWKKPIGSWVAVPRNS